MYKFVHYNLSSGILLHKYLWYIVAFVLQIQYIHGMSMGYDHIVDILTIFGNLSKY